jgi:hypothetical protein
MIRGCSSNLYQKKSITASPRPMVHYIHIYYTLSLYFKCSPKHLLYFLVVSDYICAPFPIPPSTSAPISDSHLAPSILIRLHAQAVQTALTELKTCTAVAKPQAPNTQFTAALWIAVKVADWHSQA